MEQALCRRLEELIDTSRTVVLSGVDEDGFPFTRAMLGVRKREGLDTLYFSTNTSSRKVERFRANPKACAYAYDSLNFVGLMLRGTMEVLTDRAARELLWQAGDERYYPGGVDDPDYCVLRFTTRDGRLYSGFESQDLRMEGE